MMCSVKRDFRAWHSEKERIEQVAGRALFREREIWWCSLGVNVGSEQDGSQEFFTRPIVILKKFNLDTCLIVPLTARTKQGMYYHAIGEVGGRHATAILSQLRFIDRKRLVSKIGTLGAGRFAELKDALRRACFG